MEQTDYFNKSLKPMLLEESGPFDSKDYIFELKLDGFRCIAYLDSQTVLKSRNNLDITAMFPELGLLYRQAKKSCVIDGEIIIMKDGKPDFNELQKRTRLKNIFSLDTLTKSDPASFAAFDILYLDGEFLNNRPLTERKKLLEENITESGFLSISRYIDEYGTDFFELVKSKEFEGIVAKRKSGRYYFGKRTKEWLKIKVFKEEDIVICGFYPNKNGYNLILGFLKGNGLIDAGTANILKTNPDTETILNFAKKNTVEPVFKCYKEENITWIKPQLKGSVQFSSKTKTGSLRHPIFKGLKNLLI